MSEEQTDEEQTDNCAVCLESLTEESGSVENYELVCGHIYHKSCISEWLKDHDTCPLCRTHVKISEDYVRDGVMSQERLEVLRFSAKLMMVGLGAVIERYFPSINGWTTSESFTKLMRDPQFDQALNECVDVESASHGDGINPILKIVLMITGSLIGTYFSNRNSTNA